MIIHTKNIQTSNSRTPLHVRNTTENHFLQTAGFWPGYFLQSDASKMPIIEQRKEQTRTSIIFNLAYCVNRSHKPFVVLGHPLSTVHFLNLGDIVNLFLKQCCNYRAAYRATCKGLWSRSIQWGKNHTSRLE